MTDTYESVYQKPPSNLSLFRQVTRIWYLQLLYYYSDSADIKMQFIATAWCTIWMYMKRSCSAWWNFGARFQILSRGEYYCITFYVAWNLQL